MPKRENICFIIMQPCPKPESLFSLDFPLGIAYRILLFVFGSVPTVREKSGKEEIQGQKKSRNFEFSQGNFKFQQKFWKSHGILEQ